jgi:tetratricopeptide (TPR) repeat protein
MLKLATKLLLTLCISISYISNSQLTTARNGGNLKASVSEQIGLADIKVIYNRPGVKGREGKIFGTSIAHFGFIDQGFGSSKATPWRTGANECTQISVSKDVMIEGKSLPAGTYGLFMALGENEVIVIFSKNSTAYGSFSYQEAEDVLRVNVVPQKNQPFVERLKFEFSNQTYLSAELALLWEHWRIPMNISVDLVKQELASFREELRTVKGFSSNAYMQASQYCLDNNVNLDEGLLWTELAITQNILDDNKFRPLALRSQFLQKLGKVDEAKEMINKAVKIGNVYEVNSVAWSLKVDEKYSEALAIFKFNEKKFPTSYLPKVGMAKVLSAMGKYKEALKFAKLAQTLVPENATEKANIAEIIKKLTEGKDVN